jgi:hypothetical protein
MRGKSNRIAAATIQMPGRLVSIAAPVEEWHWTQEVTGSPFAWT